MLTKCLCDVFSLETIYSLHQRKLSANQNRFSDIFTDTLSSCDFHSRPIQGGKTHKSGLIREKKTFS